MFKIVLVVVVGYWLGGDRISERQWAGPIPNVEPFSTYEQCARALQDRQLMASAGRLAYDHAKEEKPSGALTQRISARIKCWPQPDSVPTSE